MNSAVVCNPMKLLRYFVSGSHCHVLASAASANDNAVSLEPFGLMIAEVHAGGSQD